MKNQKYVLIMILLAIGTLWFFLHKPQVVISQRHDAATNAPIVTTTAIASNSVGQIGTNSNPGDTSAVAGITARYNQGLMGKEQAMQAVILEENNRSLDVYGKVVDQYSNPVAGAKIQGSIGLNVSMVESGGEIHYTETDSQGCFNFLGIHGAGIGIWPQKEGYFYNLKAPTQRPKDYYPDPNNPLIFTMWKIRGAEPLVNSSIDAKITPDGSPITFDMATGKPSPDGNFQVTLSRFPIEVKRSRDKYDWTAKIEVLGGGVISETDSYPYWAPANGYQPVLNFNASTNDIPWHPYLDRSYYIQNAQGQYGLMKLHINSSVTPTRFQAGFTFNPSGSQNLEPDFSK